MEKLNIPSIIGRLLSEISWEGNARHYRKGGRGRENVLTAETLLALDFLPRSHFMGKLIEAMRGAELTRKILVNEIENAKFDLLAGNIFLKPSETHNKRIIVQPDGIIQSNSVFTLIEAKRIKSSSFQSKQLARELVATKIEAKNKAPLLMLITGKKPPYRIDKHGKLGITEAVELYIDHVVNEESDEVDMSADDFRNLIDTCVCYITWGEVAEIVLEQLEIFECGSTSVNRSVQRMAESILTSIKWHS